MSLRDKLVADLTAAMKAKDAEKTGTLRMAKAALMNRQIEKGGELTDEEVTKALQSLVKQRRDSIEQYETEISVIEGYLPRAASTDEIASAVEAAVSETGASSMKEMGLVMKAAMTRLEGMTVDGRAVSEAVKQRLS
jgi:uncharacterized protein